VQPPASGVVAASDALPRSVCRVSKSSRCLIQRANSDSAATEGGQTGDGSRPVPTVRVPGPARAVRRMPSASGTRSGPPSHWGAGKRRSALRSCDAVAVPAAEVTHGQQEQPLLSAEVKVAPTMSDSLTRKHLRGS